MNTNVCVFLNELTAFFEEKYLLFKNLPIVGDSNNSMLLLNDASSNWIFMHELTANYCAYSQKWWKFGAVITYEEVDISEPRVSFVTNSDHWVLRFDFLQ